MPSPEHDNLTRLAAKWLKKQGFPVIATEITAIGSREQPDVIGFRSACSAIIEAKVSRSDFLADAKKPERRADGAGLGIYRFYLCPPGLIRADELPPRWGLLYAQEKSIEEVVRPPGNLWLGLDCPKYGWGEFQNVPDFDKERSVLFSIARRLAKGQRV
ncbi:hypothetical protein [Aquitalea palustris]|uniref:hypothetical protein n=1 Tax=Aquitalea palustris TaxID=2480983 RepID=UPI001CEFF1C1|nr:hypothetical protein [Aquitalea palustris]